MQFTFEHLPVPGEEQHAVVDETGEPAFGPAKAHQAVQRQQYEQRNRSGDEALVRGDGGSADDRSDRYRDREVDGGPLGQDAALTLRACR